jgi:histone deacetylase complex regulatory component SIN3
MAVADVCDAQKRFSPERDETYQQFLRIFSDYWNKRTSKEEMQNRIKELLKDEPDLVEGFEKFLSVKKFEESGGGGGGD